VSELHVIVESPASLESTVASSEPPARRRIWLCADDYGISPSVNAAIRDLVVRGRINATSVMVMAPSFQRSEAASLAILNAGQPRVAIGLHLTLTAPFRPLTADFKPVHNGAFLPLRTALVYALSRLFSRSLLQREIESQVRMFLQIFGRPPDFIDGHQHVQLFPQIGDTLLKVMKAMAPDAWVRQCGSVRSLSDQLGDRKGLLLDILSRNFRRRARAHGVRTNPAFAGTYDFDDDADFAALFPRFLDQLPDGSVVMCHPGFVDTELRRLDPLTKLREREYAYLADASFPGVLADHGMALA
jgi:chitin disaccharide deacetylase